MNLPNKITISRILLIPLVLFFFLADFIPYGKLVAALIFGIAAITDNIDGRIARKRNLVTDLGKFLDPIADKVLVMSGLLLIIAHPILGKPIIQPVWFGILCGVIILGRELIISAFRQIAATKNLVLAADKSGKIKAFFQDIAIFLYMIYAFMVAEFYAQIPADAHTAINIVLIVLMAITTVLTITSAIGYLVKNKHVLASASSDGSSERKYDALIPDILTEFFESGIVSANSIEERFDVGERRAKKIVNQMAELGYVSEEGDKREILLSESDMEEIFGERE